MNDDELTKAIQMLATEIGKQNAMLDEILKTLIVFSKLQIKIEQNLRRLI